MKRIFHTIVILLLFIKLSFAQSQPKVELRAVWMATVANLDWPKSSDKGNANKQKASFIALLESMKEVNINVIFLQVRTECDAFYNSAYEPWSRYLTGTQGVNPGYDPLKFAIEECHKRGMELHVWLNPYRINASVNDSGNYYAYNHVYRQHPSWALKYSSGKKILNPGLPQVQRYIKKIVGDIISKYDVDGVHFDDYFYSYSGTPSSMDAATYSKYGSEYATIGDFRRGSINKMIRGVMDTILAVKPYIRFGVSPFGIYGNNMNPPGISGLDAYNVIYCDPLAWLKEKSVDYITPQLYWPTGGSQDFNKLLPWWAGHAKSKNRHVYAGHGIYRLDDNPFHIDNNNAEKIHEYKEYFFLSGTENIISPDSWTLEEIIKQIRIVRKNRSKNALGSVYFRTQDFNRVHNLKKYVHDKAYTYKTLLPEQTWKNSQKPPKVANLRLEKINGDLEYSLVWDDAGKGFRYAIYVFDDSIALNNLLPDSKYLQEIIIDKNHYKPAKSLLTSGKYIAVIRINRYWKTSNVSALFKLPANIPTFISPAPNAIFRDDLDSITLRWKISGNAVYYKVQIADTSGFQHNVLDTIIFGSKKELTYKNPVKKKWLYARVAAMDADSTAGYWSNTLKFIFDTKLSIDEIIPEENILLYPNPASSVINISFDDNIITPLKIILYDNNGRLLDYKYVSYMPKSNVLTWNIKQYKCKPCFIRIENKKFIKTIKLLKYE